MKDKEWIVVLLVLVGAAWFGWDKWGKPLREARSFEGRVSDANKRGRIVGVRIPADEDERARTNLSDF